MKAERKYLATFLDAAFDTTYAGANYVRLGKDLEEFNDEMNPDVETVKNILGENAVKHNGYEVSADADPFYYEYDDALSEKVMEIAMNRLTGDACRTSKVDVLLKPGADGAAPEVAGAWREDVLLIPNSVGGDTSGVQTPFTIHAAGNRVKGTFDMSTKKFTPSENGL
jgi:hypothetical protein